MAVLKVWSIYKVRRNATIQLATMARFPVERGDVFQLLRCFYLVSGNARLPVGQLAAVFSGGSAAVSRVASRVHQRSAALGDFGSVCYDFGRRCYCVLSFRVLHRWEAVGCFLRRTARWTTCAGM